MPATFYKLDFNIYRVLFDLTFNTNFKNWSNGPPCLSICHQMAVHKRTTMLAHRNLKQNMSLCTKQSCFFPFMYCPLVANQKSQWSIICNAFAMLVTAESQQSERAFRLCKCSKVLSLPSLNMEHVIFTEPVHFISRK